MDCYEFVNDFSLFRVPFLSDSKLLFARFSMVLFGEYCPRDTSRGGRQPGEISYQCIFTNYGNNLSARCPAQRRDVYVVLGVSLLYLDHERRAPLRVTADSFVSSSSCGKLV